MNMKTFLTYYLPNIMFNIAEIGAIVGVGILFKVPIPYIISIFVCFILNRLIFRSQCTIKIGIYVLYGQRYYLLAFSCYQR